MLDEFHERHLAGDVSLALLRQLQQTARPDLKLVLMSATLEADPSPRTSAGFRGDVTFARVAPGARPVVRGSANRLRWAVTPKHP